MTRAALAQAAGLSRYHFLREFAELFGCTPHQYLIGVRIARKKELLARPGATVTDTCFEVGFSSLGSFSSLFARRTGRSPIAYHREIAPLVQVPGGVATVYVPHCFLAHFAV